MNEDLLVVFGVAFRAIEDNRDCTRAYNGLSGTVTTLAARIEQALKPVSDQGDHILEPFIFAVAFPLGHFVANVIEHDHFLPTVEEMTGFLSTLLSGHNYFSAETTEIILKNLKEVTEK